MSHSSATPPGDGWDATPPQESPQPWEAFDPFDRGLPRRGMSWEEASEERRLAAERRERWEARTRHREGRGAVAQRSRRKRAPRERTAVTIPEDHHDLAPAEVQGPRSGVARNTAIFSIATGASRIAGLAREIVAASYFGTSGPASAFTLAFQVPNLLRGLFADAALSAAFVPVFTEYLERGRRREAMLLASTLFWIILLVLGALTAVFIVAAGVIMPVFIPGSQFTPALVDLTVGLSQILFPVVVLLGLNGLLVGIANAYHHFTIPAIAPLVWNVVIIGVLVVLHGSFDGDKQIYAYAI
ncbi:MAG: hypothetical protein F2796_00230, partial [Actinobacteria bacterium]|nr:hypothetical protein [Actinomycetota bacterium]